MRTHSIRAAALAASCIIGGITFTGCAQSTENVSEQPSASTQSGAPGVATSPARDRPEVDAAALRNNVAYEIEPAASLSALAQDSDLVVTGTITGWREGRTIVPSGMRLFNAVLEVAVEDAQPGDTRFPDGKAYVEVFLGTQSLDENGQPFEADDDPLLTRLWVDDAAEAAPMGTRVILALIPAQTTAQLANEGEEIIDDGDPLPDDAVLYMAKSQGFLLENADGSYDSGIADHTYFSGDGWPEPAKDPQGFATLLTEIDAQA